MANGKLTSKGRLSKLIGGIVFGLSALLVSQGLAKDGPVAVDAEIVFAVDVSYSMDQEEQVTLLLIQQDVKVL